MSTKIRVVISFILATGIIAVIAIATGHGRARRNPVEPAPVATVVEPGGAMSFQAAGPGPFAWTADGGTITPSGAWTAPGCGAATFPAVFTITATGPDGIAQRFAVRVAEVVIGVEVLGAVVAGETVLRPPPVSLKPGQSAQFYARINHSCHVEYAPSQPPAPGI